MSHPSCWVKGGEMPWTPANLNPSLLLNPRTYLSSYPSNYACFSHPYRLSHTSHLIKLLKASGLWWQWLEVVCQQLMSLVCRSKLRNIKSFGPSAHMWTLSLGRLCTGKSLRKISVKCIFYFKTTLFVSLYRLRMSLIPPAFEYIKPFIISDVKRPTSFRIQELHYLQHILSSEIQPDKFVHCCKQPWHELKVLPLLGSAFHFDF